MIHPTRGMWVEYRNQGETMPALVCHVDPADEAKCTLCVFTPMGSPVAVDGATLNRPEGFFMGGHLNAGKVGGAAAVGVRGEGEGVGQKAPHGQHGRAPGKGDKV